MRYRNILFDLDGTLTDPKVGITTCVQYALEHFGIREPDNTKLEPFIGPPLKDSFMRFYQMEEETAQQAVEKYRERFSKVGLYENEIYEGIPDLLRELRSNGCCLAVASSKPTVFVKQILQYFEIEDYFDVAVGSELNGARVEKEEVVAEALRCMEKKNPVDKSACVMVGDRCFDIQGAKQNGLDSIGVAYGYAAEGELEQAGATFVAQTVEELRNCLLG